LASEANGPRKKDSKAKKRKRNRVSRRRVEQAIEPPRKQKQVVLSTKGPAYRKEKKRNVVVGEPSIDQIKGVQSKRKGYQRPKKGSRFRSRTKKRCGDTSGGKAKKEDSL